MIIRVLTYNIHKAIGVDRRFAPDRIAEVLQRHNADVVLLQEVDRFHPRSNLLDLASYLSRRLEYRYRAASMNVFMKQGKYGNATLSRFPIGRQQNIDLTVGRAKRRGAQHTRLHLSDHGRGIDLDIFNIHLSLAGVLRATQIRRLLSAPDIKNLSNDARIIVAGDMNDWRGVLKRSFFEPSGFACATNRFPGSRWAIRTFPSYAPTLGVDKIFYRGPLRLIRAHRSRLKLARVASDHLPVMAEFEI